MSATAADFPVDLQRHVLRSKIPGVKQFCAWAGWNLYQSPIGLAAKNRVNSDWHDTERAALEDLEIKLLETLA